MRGNRVIDDAEEQLRKAVVGLVGAYINDIREKLDRVERYAGRLSDLDKSPLYTIDQIERLCVTVGTFRDKVERAKEIASKKVRAELQANTQLDPREPGGIGYDGAPGPGPGE